MVLRSTVSLLIINKYWTRLSRSIIGLSLWLWCWQFIIFCNNWVQKSFYHLITKFVFNEYLWEAKQSALSRKSDRKKEKSMVSFMHEQNIICSQTQLDDIAHELTIICRQLFAGYMVGSWPMKRNKNLHWMIYMYGIYTIHVYATTALSLRINSCLQGQVDLTLDKYM